MAIPVLFLESSGHPNAVADDVAINTALLLIQTLLSIRKCNRSISINCPDQLSRVEIAPNRTLQSVLAGPEYMDQWLLIRTLESNSPLSYGCAEWIETVEKAEVTTIAGNVSLALLWAYLSETATVSLHIPPIWHKDQISAQYSCLDDAGNLQTASPLLINFSSPLHTDIHHTWLSKLSNGNAASVVWKDRNLRFPGLRFVGGVERLLAELAVAGAPYVQALETLAILSADALKWGGKKDPNFSVKVASGEHDKRRELTKFFDESKGKYREFGRHAYFTGGVPGRIHFIVDAAEKRFIVGYIGNKL